MSVFVVRGAVFQEKAMVYTVTFNPAIDYVMHFGRLIKGKVNRSSSEEIFYGGKGINVSAVLAELGVKSVTLGFVAGFTGEAIENGVKAMGIETDFVHLENGCSRINVKLKSDDVTELNGQGPEIDSAALNKLFSKLEKLESGDVLVLAGSIPRCMPSDVYEHILARLSGRNIRFVVDAEKSLLLNVLKYKPFLVKPNIDELGAMFGVELHNDDEITEYAEKLRDMGAQNVLVSMAGNGALLIDETGKCHKLGVCRGSVRSAVGAGDSMVAGFIAGSMNGDFEYALKLGTACGGATAFSDGLAKKEYISKLLWQLEE